MKKHYDFIIFDFDGTLTDYIKLFPKYFNELAEKEGFVKITDLERSRSYPLRRFLKEHKIRFSKLHKLLAMGKKMQREVMNQVHPPKGLKEVLAKLKETHRLGILSSNKKSMIKDFLVREGIDDYFDFVIGYPKLFRKWTILLKIKLEYRLKGSRMLYVGDEVRDINSAKRAMIDIASVTWGFNNEFILKKFKPTYIVRKPKELLEILD
jgi:phosphoglycolate phosphatase